MPHRRTLSPSPFFINSTRNSDSHHTDNTRNITINTTDSYTLQTHNNNNNNNNAVLLFIHTIHSPPAHNAPPAPPHTTSGITPATTNTTLRTLPPAPTPLLNAVPCPYTYSSYTHPDRHTYPTDHSHISNHRDPIVHNPTRRDVTAEDLQRAARANAMPCPYTYSSYTHPDRHTNPTDHSHISNHRDPIVHNPIRRDVTAQDLQRAARANAMPCPYTYSSYTHPDSPTHATNHSHRSNRTRLINYTHLQPLANTTATAAQNETETDGDSAGRAGMFRYGRAPYVRGRGERGAGGDGGVLVAQEGQGEGDEAFETWCRAQVLLEEE